MHTATTYLLILLCSILSLVEVYPVYGDYGNQHHRYSPENELNKIWRSIQPAVDGYLNETFKPYCERRLHPDLDGYVKYCFEKILKLDGQSYEIKVNATLYKFDGTIIPLHQGQRTIEPTSSTSTSTSTYNPMV